MARQDRLVIRRIEDSAIESPSTFLTALGHIHCRQGEERLMLAVLNHAGGVWSGIIGLITIPGSQHTGPP